MARISSKPSTGLPGLDKVIRGLITGDNVVWQVDCLDDFKAFARPYYKTAVDSGQRVIYFRFAKHAPLVCEGEGVEIHQLSPEDGFEQFITGIHRVIKDVGKGGYYLFDCLSELAVDWYSDQMLGNFFMLTCPYLYDMETIAYFPLLRNYHSFYAISPITETTQILLDVLRHEDQLYLHPMKVQQRYSSTMHMLHAWRGDEFHPVTNSSTISKIRSAGPWRGLDSSDRRMDVWNRVFMEAEKTLIAEQAGEACSEKVAEDCHHLRTMAISRHDRMLGLAEKYFTLSDILDIGRRIVGTGLIGGKSVGMLLARAILKQMSPRWGDVLEPHDSFFIGSDVFYTFLVTNGLWWVRQHQRNGENIMAEAEAARRGILVGVFPKHIEAQFASLLDYFGQSPIIVRSSSLLEDNFGNAFAGKYESVFCVNQGPRHKRLEDFLAAVRTVYASTMSEEALAYRARRGLLDRDEQMALLVQRVSGAAYDNVFYPQVAGVGLSFNPYVWSRDIDPTAGVLRLVFGLGTRAVDRHDDDYTRVVALNAPERRPEANFEEAKQNTQKRVEVLSLEANQLQAEYFSEVAARSENLPLELFASRDEELVRRSKEAGISQPFAHTLTFKKLLNDTEFVDNLREMLQILQNAYDYPVETEFTANFLPNGQHTINLLQCRPFQCQGGGTVPDIPEDIEQGKMIASAAGAVIGHSRAIKVDRLIYVVPAVYSELSVSDRYQVARLIGKLVHVKEQQKPENVMLLGPGRWGTTTPWLGVPINFSDISTVSVLCEIVAMREGLVPEVSLGTHLFGEMVEMDMLYLALFPEKEGNLLNDEFFATARNRLVDLVPDAGKWVEGVKVVDASDIDAAAIKLNANTLAQKAVCYIEE
ncbi:MAG: pyruvate, phosphate dikinase [bacterium]|nr:pyruvate, phosphate dikinase [bacterium]